MGIASDAVVSFLERQAYSADVTKPIKVATMNRRTFFRLPVTSPSPRSSVRTPLQPLSIRAGLEQYTGALDPDAAAHLLRRTGGIGPRPLGGW